MVTYLFPLLYGTVDSAAMTLATLTLHYTYTYGINHLSFREIADLCSNDTPRAVGMAAVDTLSIVQAVFFV